MKKLIAIAAVAALVGASPAMAGGFGHHRGGNDRALVNVGDVDVLSDAQFLNGVYVGNNANVLSGILNGNTILQNNDIPVLNGLNLFSKNKRGGRRW